MDLFNISAVELIVLFFLGGVVLGPRRLAKLGRDVGQVIRQIRALTGDLTKQLNLEIDLLEAAEGKPPEGTSTRSARDKPLVCAPGTRRIRSHTARIGSWLALSEAEPEQSQYEIEHAADGKRKREHEGGHPECRAPAMLAHDHQQVGDTRDE